MKLNIGCGRDIKEGWENIDAIDFGQGKKNVYDVRKGIKAKDNTVDEIHCSHFIEHLTWPERVSFFNELYRVMKPEAKATIILPHWCSARYYGDPTHKEPFSEFAFYYLSSAWREQNAPHVGYTCNFECTWGYSLNPALAVRNQEYQQYAITNYKEAATDIHATMVKK
jgi:hypothetical protein